MNIYNIDSIENEVLTLRNIVLMVQLDDISRMIQIKSDVLPD